MIDEIRAKIVAGRFEFSRHAVDQTLLRGIAVEEIRQALIDGIIIENYPDDKYGPSCLVFGNTKNGRALYIQCSYPSRELIKSLLFMNRIPSYGWIPHGE